MYTTIELAAAMAQGLRFLLTDYSDHPLVVTIRNVNRDGSCDLVVQNWGKDVTLYVFGTEKTFEDARPHPIELTDDEDLILDFKIDMSRALGNLNFDPYRTHLQNKGFFVGNLWHRDDVEKKVEERIKGEGLKLTEEQKEDMIDWCCGHVADFQERHLYIDWDAIEQAVYDYNDF